MPRFRSLPGTQDWLPDRLALRRHVEDAGRAVFERAGFRELLTPTLEATELFVRTSGEGSDVVAKEMYSFVDRGDRAVSLRPEFTAGTLRAYIEHGMAKLPQPVRVFSTGSSFRFNRPQRGRYREFAQFNVEAVGSADPAVDAEVIALELAWLEGLGLEGLELELNSIDEPAARRAYVADLVRFLDGRADELSADVRRLRDVNPLRAFDTKDPRSRAILAEAPKITDRLSAPAAAHFEQVRAFLDARGIRYVVDPTLVRGLDYYTHTAWELKWPPLGAQSALGGGGRYDGFVEALGGPPTPGVGFAVGVDRIVLALEAQGIAPVEAPAPVAYFVITAAAARPALHAAMDGLRRRGIACEADLAGRSESGQRKQAARVGAALVVHCGEPEWERGEADVLDRRDGRHDTVALDRLVPTLEARSAPA